MRKHINKPEKRNICTTVFRPFTLRLGSLVGLYPTCQECMNSTLPKLTNIPAMRISSRFHQHREVDLMFYKDFVFFISWTDAPDFMQDRSLTTPTLAPRVRKFLLTCIQRRGSRTMELLRLCKWTARVDSPARVQGQGSSGLALRCK